MTMNIHEILKKLPHRYPFLLVDRVLELEHGKRIKALKNVTINEPYFLGHFPHRPVMPGVLMLEALAQAAALLSFDAPEPGARRQLVYYFAGIDGALQAAGGAGRPADPGRHARAHEVGIYKFKARASVDGEVAVEADLMCAVRNGRVAALPADGADPPDRDRRPGRPARPDVEVGPYSIVGAARPDRRRHAPSARTA